MVTAALPADDYPSTTPQVANFDAAQQINCGADFTLAWQPLNSTSDRFVWVSVDEPSSGETVFSSPWVGTQGALNGTDTSVVIPAGTLRTGYSYLVTVMPAALTLDTVSYPGALGLIGYNKQTQFNLTVPGTPFPKSLHIVNATRGQLQLMAIGEPGRTNILEAATNLAAPSWTALATNVGSFDYSETMVPSARCYRFRDATAAGP